MPDDARRFLEFLAAQSPGQQEAFLRQMRRFEGGSELIEAMRSSDSELLYQIDLNVAEEFGLIPDVDALEAISNFYDLNLEPTFGQTERRPYDLQGYIDDEFSSVANPEPPTLFNGLPSSPTLPSHSPHLRDQVISDHGNSVLTDDIFDPLAEISEVSYTGDSSVGERTETYTVADIEPIRARLDELRAKLDSPFEFENPHIVSMDLSPIYAIYERLYAQFDSHLRPIEVQATTEQFASFLQGQNPQLFYVHFGDGETPSMDELLRYFFLSTVEEGTSIEFWSRLFQGDFAYFWRFGEQYFGNLPSNTVAQWNSESELSQWESLQAIWEYFREQGIADFFDIFELGFIIEDLLNGEITSIDELIANLFIAGVLGGAALAALNDANPNDANRARNLIEQNEDIADIFNTLAESGRRVSAVNLLVLTDRGYDIRNIASALMNAPQNVVEAFFTDPNFLRNLPNGTTNSDMVEFYIRTWPHNNSEDLVRGARESRLWPTITLEEFNAGDLSATTATNANANALRRSMFRASTGDGIQTGHQNFPDTWGWSARVPQQGEQAHHIVPALAAQDSDAMKVLNRFGIHPNSAYNGVGIPAEFHTSGLLHGAEYKLALDTALQQAKSPEEVIDILDQIAFIIDSEAIKWKDGLNGIGVYVDTPIAEIHGEIIDQIVLIEIIRD